MIYTVTLNPALDRFIVVEQLLAEDTTRISFMFINSDAYS